MADDPVAVHATPDDLADAGTALAASFTDDPVQRWLFDGAEDYGASIGRFFRFFVDEYFALGHVYVPKGDAPAGAAMWAPPGRGILHDERRVTEFVDMVQAGVSDDITPKLMELARAEQYRPKEPHFYLGILGVAPARQGLGLGEVLVQPVIAIADRAGIPTHLESSNPRNLGFYERLGFETTDEYRCGGEPLMTIMTRPPA